MRPAHLLILILAVVIQTAGCSEPSHGTPGDGDADSEASEYPWNDNSLVVMTFNVMCSFCSNSAGDNEAWEQRVPHFGDIIDRHAPDLIGLQELTYAKEVQEILDVAPGYRAVYGHDFPKNEIGWTDYPDATILYREERFNLEESGTYWNSATPDEAWAGGWQSGSAFWRIVVWAHLRQLSDGRDFYFATTHFDNNPPNQEHSAPLAIERFAPLAAGHPVVFVGDYNSQPDSAAYATLAQGIGGQGFHFTNAFDLAATWSAVTNLESPPGYDPAERIDHIFLAGTAAWGGQWWKVDQTVYGERNRYPSDHYPVVSGLTWQIK